MTEGSYTPPPPPPPSEPVYTPPPPPGPPGPEAPSRTAFDFVKPLTFAFEDPNWLPKILIGGLFMLASFVIVGAFFLLGYYARLSRNVIAGVQHPLPEWDDLGAYFAEGLKLFFVFLLYCLPIFVIIAAVIVPAIVMSGIDNDVAQTLGGGIASCAWCLIMPLSLAVAFFAPAAGLMVITSGNFGAAFDFGRIWRFIRDNPANYLLAFVVHFVAQFAAQLGIIILCVGLLFTSFWAMCASSYAFAQAYRLSQEKA